MTVTYDPRHPDYGDEGDLREEMTRVFDLCAGCRLCQSLCPSFHTLLGLVDSHDGEAKLMTAPEQDQVVDECYQCKLCYLKCPYVPPHEWELDFPRLMLRAESRKAEKAGPKYKLTTEVLARTDLLGHVGVASAPVANPILQKPGSPVRQVMDKVLGVAAERVLPPYAKQRFSTWFRKRGAGRLGRVQQNKVALFHTCMVEYHDTSVGQDLVKVYERNGVRCDLVEGWRCCGAPWLHSGEHERFRAQAQLNVEALVRAVRQGADVVVPE
ncbi:MAG: heterodisulfide reductase-related iron-sulfur binding cluster, partial [Acidimicrobiales bacterium]